MSSQIVLAVLSGLVLILAVRRMVRIRSLKQYSPQEVDALLGPQGNIVLLDVRTDVERKRSAIRGSLHIPLQSLRARIKELERHRAKEIVCYCQSGNRSVSAALLLRREGFTVANLRGGMADWNFAQRQSN